MRIAQSEYVGIGDHTLKCRLCCGVVVGNQSVDRKTNSIKTCRLTREVRCQDFELQVTWGRRRSTFVVFSVFA
jgi:hypothetical protein